MSSRFTNGTTTNLQMNDQTYQLRRKVMNYIYEANRLLQDNKLPRMPRVDVRITDNDSTMLGCARTADNIIWITARAVTPGSLRYVVFHELAHAVYGANHSEKNSLMNPFYKNLDRYIVNECFLKIARGGN